ncbi:TPA: hypothetical protein IHM15_004492 [Escherichia coli]|nr:hypothetical protein [Escherichia coli]
MGSEYSHIEIDGGTVTGATITTDKGTRPIPYEVGSKSYFVDVIEIDGGHIGMWSGSTYEEAVKQAEVLRKDFNVSVVRDKIEGGMK